jgi:hypothetical protein
MSNWHYVARLRDFGIGVAGRQLGPPCSIYRPIVTGDWIQGGNLVVSNYYAWRRISVSKADQESPAHTFGTLFFELIVDLTNFFVGDLFIENDPFYGTGGTAVDFTTVQFPAHCVASHAPNKTPIGARIDRTALFYRPVTGTDTNGFFSPTLNQNVQPIICTSGVFSLGTVGSAACRIPVGMMAMPRDRDTVYKGAPGDTGVSVWFCYVPPLNGFNPRPGDRIVTSAGRYVVKHPYQQQVGIVGSQLMCSLEQASS